MLSANAIRVNLIAREIQPSGPPRRGFRGKRGEFPRNQSSVPRGGGQVGSAEFLIASRNEGARKIHQKVSVRIYCFRGLECGKINAFPLNLYLKVRFFEWRSFIRKCWRTFIFSFSYFRFAERIEETNDRRNDTSRLRRGLDSSTGGNFEQLGSEEA